MKIKQFVNCCLIIVAILVFSPFVSSELSAQAEDVFNGVRFNDSLDTVKQKINNHAKSLRVVSVETPTFPLAKEKEQHLICNGYTLKDGVIDEIAFTFSDDKLTNIEARGNAVNVLTGNRKDKPTNYLGYWIYRSDMMVASKKEDSVWFLTRKTAHINLFAWSNPHLPSNKGERFKYKESGKIPDMLKMGGNIDELLPMFKTNSKFTNREELDGSDPNAQVQINCFGVEYAGFPRKMEARFGNGKLNVVWILTAREEENRVRNALIEAYGKPVFVNEAWEAFKGWEVLLRKDKPEVLVVNKPLVEANKKEILNSKN